MAVGQIQQPLLDERIGLSRDIPNLSGMLPVKILVHGKSLLFDDQPYHFVLDIPTPPCPAGQASA